MNKAFLNCVAKGGFIRTIQKKGGKYQRTCSLGGKTYKGEVKKKKKIINKNTYAS